MQLLIAFLMLVFVASAQTDERYNKAYRTESLGTNSAYADISPVMMEDDRWMFLSDRWKKGKSTLERPRYLAYDVASVVEVLSTMIPKRWMRKYHVTHVSVSKDRSRFLMTGVEKRKGTGSLLYKVYLVDKDENGKWTVRRLDFGNLESSYRHASFGKDDKVIFVASDVSGTYGGLDIYQSLLQADGSWSELKNVGTPVNTSSDEDYPFQGNDGVLYFSSKSHQTTGGFDVFQSQIELGRWQEPQNIGFPVNSDGDDINYVINSVNRRGYFVSNRNAAAGGYGVFAFTRDDRLLDYDVTVKVIDADSKRPIDFALLQLKGGSGPSVTDLTGSDGIKVLKAPGGKTVQLEVSKEGFESNTSDISPTIKNDTVTVKLTRSTFKLIIQVRDNENRFPVRSASIVIRNTMDGTEQTFYALESGVIDAYLIPQVVYEVSSTDYPSIKDQISPVVAAGDGRTIYREYFVSRKEMLINVPISSDCFSSNTLVNVTNLRTRKVDIVQVGEDGRMFVDMERNSKYEVEQNGKADTIDTRNLMPGDMVKVNCTFKVGQKWLVQNLYYDVNKAELKAESLAELDKLVDVMERHPSLEIELSAHTDCRSSKRYNDLLSAKRAMSAVNYIVEKGISKRRVIAAGYGERKLVNECKCEPENTSSCPDEKHAQNRRTEVKVLKY